MRNLIIPFVLFSVLVISACEKTVELDLKQIEPKIVIEGQVTDKPGFQYVKVSRSNGFYATGKTPRVTNALVSVSDSDGNEIDFIHNPNNHPDLNGYYFPAPTFAGEIGKTYTLHVEVDGEQYEAEDHLYPVLTVDSITYEIDEDEFDDPEDEGKYYVIKMYAKEPQQTVDYYLFRFYRNDSLILENPNDLYFADDETLGEKIEGAKGPLFYAEKDTAQMEIYSLSRRGYVFYSDLATLLNSDGGMFSPPPANTRSNLSNGALGFFQVSAVNRYEVIIEP